MGGVEKSCGRCGHAFVCGQYGCWCTRIGVTDWQYDWITDHFPDCLCPGCLEKVSTGQIGPIPKRPLV
ncbi:MAG: cysteine-rich CWC family protein [Nitrospirae bacterium]|nr:cysteine-rich CWC family protein [Nitrospirota bacterium]